MMRQAEQCSPGGTSKAALSDRLQGLKFMQRARAREETVRKEDEEELELNDSQWVTPGQGMAASSNKCVVIVEGDPKPGALLGRMSFQNFNPSVEKIVEEVEARRRRLRLSSSSSNGESNNTQGKDRKTATAADDDQVSLRKKQKTETLVKREVSSGSSHSSQNPSLLVDDVKLSQHLESKKGQQGRDWRHLRPPGN